ncbi:MAG: PEGA domain-containing protein [Fidelibacterota bacterium]
MKQALILLSMIALSWGQVKVTIETIPPEATVTIDGAKVGETPLNDLSLTPGKHIFRIKLERYSPIHYETYLLAAEKATLRFRLKERFNVKFISEVPEYNYRFDQKYPWFEEKMKFEMEAGRHDLEIFDGDSLVDRKSILIDQNTTIHYSLE